MTKMFLLFAVLLGTATTANAQRKCGVVVPTSYRVGIYTAGELEGKTLGDLYAAYIGVRTIPAHVSVDPVRQLDSLWLVKMSCNKTGAVVHDLRTKLVASYKEGKSPKTLREFVSIADREVRQAKNDLVWDRLATLYSLSERELQVVRTLSDGLSGKDFVAYGMTEIMPTDNGVLNMQVLEFLVRNYGPEFVYRIPAIHDKYASFGFFQFTSLAVNGKTLEGASRASLALSQHPLPGSVQDIEGTLQFRAAYLFAIHNIARMVHGLSSKQVAVLSSLGSRNHDDLVQFIAAAHNSPAHAYSGAHRWLDNRMKKDFFISVGNSSVRRYAYKTKMNLSALRTHKELSGILYLSR